MKSFKDPSFQDRIGRAAQAKQQALDKLRAKPPVDEKLVAERQAKRLKREAAEAEKRAARLAAQQAAKAEKASAAEVKKAPAVSPPTAEDMKRARDARYAARKNRK